MQDDDGNMLRFVEFAYNRFDRFKLKKINYV